MNPQQLGPMRGLTRSSQKPSLLVNECVYCRRRNHRRSFFTSLAPLEDEHPVLSARSRADNAKERLAEREVFLSLLQNSASRRDAKSYISRFALSRNSEPKAKPKTERPGSEVAGTSTYDIWRLKKTGVNLGNLYAPAKAIEDSPVFTQRPLPEKPLTGHSVPLHVALVKVRQPQLLDDDILSGIGLTLNQLVRLGLNIVVVVDCDGNEVSEELGDVTPGWQREILEQSDRIVAAISEHSKAGAIRISDALGKSDARDQIHNTVHVRGGVEMRTTKLLLPLLEAGIIPVIPPVAWSTDTVQRKRAHPDDVLLALTRGLSGITARAILERGTPRTIQEHNDDARLLQNIPSIDRIIILDPLGGLPSAERADKAHVFINLEQEYEEVREELQEMNGGTSMSSSSSPPAQDSSVLGSSNPFSQFAETEFGAQSATSAEAPITSPSERNSVAVRHIKNLDIVERTLRLLPPSSSALIITPESAAISSQRPSATANATGVRTRRQKNPLIHNLLTDKPMVSSSLPTSRFSRPPNPSSSANPPTFIKRGIPLTMIPDPRKDTWKPPGSEGDSLTLTDPQIDLARLLYLIEDSFMRKLDIQHYLDRIHKRLAGIIIAGEYEGGAILTWEEPPPRIVGAETQPQPRPPVPYLDKFAVLQRAQGSGGVADIVFKAMVRSCFPSTPPPYNGDPLPPITPGVGEGVVWRSRANNPVNKWYFERAAGTWKLPGDQWTMFWTTEGIERDKERFLDYFAICKGVVPSWADGKKPD